MARPTYSLSNPVFRTDPDVARQVGRAVATRRITACVRRLRRMLIDPDDIVRALRCEARWLRRATKGGR
jgi:hypothetical protein